MAFHFLMISAMYENGGNVTQRLLDGHPELYVYPFESQLGTRLVNDNLSSMFPVKYRWPVFDLDASPDQDYRDMIDEECKVRARTPHVSKFRHVPFEFSDQERLDAYLEHVGRALRSRPGNVEAFFRSTFEVWKNHRASGQQRIYVGYSPIVVVDADKILRELPQAHVLHVVRNPWSAYSDTKKRPMPLSLSQYMLCWVINQFHAFHFVQMFPGRLHILRFEDIVADPMGTLGSLCKKIDLQIDASLQRPSWNSTPLDEVYPWGTIRKATTEVNCQTADELSDAEKSQIRDFAGIYIEQLDYKNFLSR